MLSRPLSGPLVGETQTLTNNWSVVVPFIRDRHFGRGFCISLDVSGPRRAKISDHEDVIGHDFVSPKFFLGPGGKRRGSNGFIIMISEKTSRRPCTPEAGTKARPACTGPAGSRRILRGSTRMARSTS